MDVAGGAVLGRELRCSTAAAVAAAITTARRGCIGRVSVRPQRNGSGGYFADDGHLRYYGSPVRCGGRKEEKLMMKKREKLIKGLVGLQAVGGLDLQAAMAGGEIEDGKVTVDKVADALLARLGFLRDEEKETKTRRKKEQKNAMKAAPEQMELPCDESSSSSSEEDGDDMNRKSENVKTQMKPSCEKTKGRDKCEDSSSSSSSSSESSDSDCEEEVIDMKDSRPVPAEAPPTLTIEKPQSSGESSTATISSLSTEEMPKAEARCSIATAASPAAERIEVCMGGKCKKSGAMELMQEFQQRVGVEGAVVGCKCLGKCKQGPNVRVRSAMNAAGAAEAGEFMAVKAEKAPLCLSVGIEDVGAIVASFFAEGEELGMAAA